MICSLLSFEIRNRLWRLSSLAYFLVFLSIGFFLALAVSGALPGVHFNMGTSGKLCVNSPYSLHRIIFFGGYFGLLITAPIFGQAINKDFESRFSQILFSTPLKKSTYFLVRYIGALISSVTILSFVAVGIFLVTLLPFVDPAMITKNQLWFYIAPYLLVIVPNTMVFGAIFIGIAAVAKRMAPVYVASIIAFTCYLIAVSLAPLISDRNLPALLDPMGLIAANEVTRYWSAAQQSTQTTPLRDLFLYNRLLWIGLSMVLLSVGYLSFDPSKLPKEKALPAESELPVASEPINMPEVDLAPNSLQVLWGLAVSECKLALASIHLRMILLCGIIFVLSTAESIGKTFGTDTLPVTYNVLDVINGQFSLFVVIISTFYAGELAWKERDAHFAELIDSKPISSLHLYLSRLLTMSLIQVVLALVVMVCCVGVQISKGYYNFEWNVYFQHLFVFYLPQWLFIDFMALFVHTLSMRKYIGHSIMIFYYALLPSLGTLGLDHRLYLIGDFPLASYSDMNGYGTSAYPFFVFSLYWGFFSLIGAVLALLFWPRGTEEGYISRFKDLPVRFNIRYKVALTIALAGFVGTGSFIFYNTNILNTYVSKAGQEKERADYEKQFKRFEYSPQPELTAVNLHADLFPETQTIKTSGTLTYTNKTKSPITEVLMYASEDDKTERLDWSKPAKIKARDPILECRIYAFDKPIEPGESLRLDFSITRAPKGFSNDEFKKDIVQNGSFIQNTTLYPIVGYMPQVELADNKTRRNFALNNRSRMPGINESKALDRTYISHEGTWIDFDATVSTSADQIALAPGTLMKHWQEGGRNYYQYHMDRPMLNHYGILSARYAVAKDKWNDVDIEIYYHPTHTKNIKRMIDGTKASLEYYTKNFGPYQYKQLRIAEFPRYRKLAQSFATLIPFSESAGFIANVKEDDPDGIDYPFFVTAHEVGHQWWAHQVIGGNVQGATMLSESLAEYSALMVQEKEFGLKRMKKYLDHELDSYLTGRRTEVEKELPLALNEQQEYIHYGKGGLVFYILRSYLGEETLNKVLRQYIHDVEFQSAPFTRSVDLVERLREVAPPQMKYLIKDLFESITFYTIRFDKVNVTDNGDNFDVKLTGHCRKYVVDGEGNGTETPMNDLIEIGCLDKAGKVLYLQKHLIKSGKNVVRFTMKENDKKSTFYFDPYNRLLRIREGTFGVPANDDK